MVSTTLNLHDHLLERGRYLQQLGRHHDATRILIRLASYRDLPIAIAEETQFRLGELMIRRRKYVRARRHLALALKHGPENARYHYLMGSSLDNERNGDLARAEEHYRLSLERDATQTDCLCAYGLLLLRLGRAEEGVTHLRQAAEAAPDDVQVLSRVVTGLRKASRTDEARGLLLAARFRHRYDSRYLKLWNDFQFQNTRRQQDAERHSRGQAAAKDRAAVLLPFVRGDDAPAGNPWGKGRIIRHDAPTVSAPHPGLTEMLPDQKHAQ